jgi:signal transduction histidine kinase
VTTLFKFPLKSLLYAQRRFLKDKDNFRGDLERFFLTYNVLIVAIFCCIAFVFTHFYTKEQKNILVDFTILFLLLITYFFLLKGWIWQGKLLGTFASNLFIVLNASLQGRESGFQYIFFPIVCGILMVFNLKEKLFSFICLFFTFACIIFLETTEYSFLMQGKVSNQSIKLNSMVALLFSVGLVFIYVRHIIRSNFISFNRVRQLNNKLIAQKRDLQKVNNELDNFVYKASHDLRSPLSSILGLINLMKSEQDLQKLKEYVSYQEKSIHKLDLYILNILTISRNSRMNVEFKQIDLKSLFESILLQLNYLPSFSSIEKKIEVNQDIPFYSDYVRLSVILNNLISNSIRYLDRNKAKSVLLISADVSKEQVTIRIYDNGIGIKKEFIHKIFNMYFRATETVSGSGLGLYIVKETLERLDGSIIVNSKYGLFTEFSLCIPNVYGLFLSDKPTVERTH